MKHVVLALVALLATAGPAMAGIESHLTADLDGERHTVDVFVGDDGSLVVLVDGEPLAAPALPGAPEAPATPELPAIPTLP